jgi:hypothetical protein
MNSRKLYANEKLILAFLKELNEVEIMDDGWAIKYIDPKAGQHWLKSQINSEYNGGGDFILINLPEPLTEELIEIALSSKNEDEVVAASLRLRDNEEFKGNEFRKALIDKLNCIELDNLHSEEKQRLINIIKYSELDNEINRQEILNKGYKEILKDANFYKSVAEQAATILRRLDKI